MFHSLMVGVLAAFAALAAPINVAVQSCTGNPVTVQILGSGGPGINPDRASASYRGHGVFHYHIAMGFSNLPVRKF